MLSLVEVLLKMGNSPEEMLRLVCLLTNLLRKLDVGMSLKQQVDRLFEV